MPPKTRYNFALARMFMIICEHAFDVKRFLEIAQGFCKVALTIEWQFVANKFASTSKWGKKHGKTQKADRVHGMPSENATAVGKWQAGCKVAGNHQIEIRCEQVRQHLKVGEKTWQNPESRPSSRDAK